MENTTYSEEMARVDSERRKAFEKRDAVRYCELCLLQGVRPESQELYIQGKSDLRSKQENCPQSRRTVINLTKIEKEGLEDDNEDERWYKRGQYA